MGIGMGMGLCDLWHIQKLILQMCRFYISDDFLTLFKKYPNSKPK